MQRREFLAALFGTAAAAAAFPTFFEDVAVPPPVAPRWIMQAEALQVGDVFTIAGVHALNPLTRRPIAHLQRFLVTGQVTGDTASPQIYPPLIVEGPYANVDTWPAHDAALQVGWTDEWIGEPAPAHGVRILNP
jgi:hypothetical protein